MVLIGRQLGLTQYNNMALSVKAGTYTGNGSDPQTISGVGFQPKVVIVFATSGGADQQAACFKTTDMATGASGLTSNMGENGQQTLGLIDSFNSDGFTVRERKNTNAVVYQYLALGGTDCVTGTYTGNATDNRSISGIGFRPKWLVIQGGTNHSHHKSTATGNATDSAQLLTAVADGSNTIQALEADGFQVGSAAAANQDAVVFYYFAIQEANVTSGTYTGNATDDRSITGVGFDPVAVIVKQTSSQQGRGYSGNTGDSSNFMRSAAPAANGIQSLIADGFTIGTDATVNANTATYFWVAFGETPLSLTANPELRLAFI